MSVWSHAPAIAGLYTCGINLIGAKAVLVDQARIDKGWAPLPTLTLAGTAALGGWFGGFYEIAKGHSHVAHDADARQLYFAGCCVNIAGSTLHILPDGKHNLHIRFADEVNGLVREFMASA